MSKLQHGFNFSLFPVDVEWIFSLHKINGTKCYLWYCIRLKYTNLEGKGWYHMGWSWWFLVFSYLQLSGDIIFQKIDNRYHKGRCAYVVYRVLTSTNLLKTLQSAKHKTWYFLIVAYIPITYQQYNTNIWFFHHQCVCVLSGQCRVNALDSGQNGTWTWTCTYPFRHMNKYRISA